MVQNPGKRARNLLRNLCPIWCVCNMHGCGARVPCALPCVRSFAEVRMCPVDRCHDLPLTRTALGASPGLPPMPCTRPILGQLPRLPPVVYTSHPLRMHCVSRLQPLRAQYVPTFGASVSHGLAPTTPCPSATLRHATSLPHATLSCGRTKPHFLDRLQTPAHF